MYGILDCFPLHIWFEKGNDGGSDYFARIDYTNEVDDVDTPSKIQGSGRMMMSWEAVASGIKLFSSPNKLQYLKLGVYYVNIN